MIAAMWTVHLRPSGRRRFTAAGSPFRSRCGYSLIELLVVMIVATTLIVTAIPRATSMIHERRLHGAANHLRSLLRHARSRAVAEARYIGLVFDETEDDPVYSLYADGNHNGIRRADIRRGIDVRLHSPYRLSETFPGVRYGSLPEGADEPFFPGLRIGRSKIVSFSPLGYCTSGTLFLSNEYGLIYAVVVLGSTGRVRVARFRAGRWQPV